jgi:hypothetical protein
VIILFKTKKEFLLFQKNIVVFSLSSKEKSPSVETERPLTIACHMKIFTSRQGASKPWLINYFLVESTVTFVVESVVTTVVSGAGVVTTVSVVVIVLSVFVSSLPLLHAAITPATAKIANNFFIVQCVL